MAVVIQPALAGNEPWVIEQFEERCVASQSFEGPGSTDLSVSSELDGRSIVLVSNSNWSIVERQRYPDIALRMGDYVYNGPATGYDDGPGRRGLSATMPASFLDDFARGASLRITNGDQLVDSLSLRGSAAAARSLRACISRVSQIKAASDRERARLAHIPVDPFASSERSSETPALPLTSVQWSRPPRPTDADYPARAAERGVTGAVMLSCGAAANGSPRNCAVVAETPSGVGFGAAAIRVVQRAQLSPATVDRMTAADQFRVTISFPPTD